MVRVKICGITNKENALQAAYAGAWALGFVFYNKSGRYISPSKARKIIEALPPFVVPVGVFVNAKEGAIKDICEFTRIHTLQFHGEEDAIYCKRFKEYKIIKAFRIGERFNLNSVQDYMVDAYLFDTLSEKEYGGSGQAFDWNLMKDIRLDRPVILSGGLNPANVAEAIKIVQPFAVDVSSGVEESPGRKDSRQVNAFLEAVHG
ncbi:MAG TPA: phosphoribosylanthranilate isomerase [Candidatus Omnitrophota bacterium]|nr:phosphoribosylanthranilate isomerase [Candidatus Omnitrophota bacterium]